MILDHKHDLFDISAYQAMEYVLLSNNLYIDFWEAFKISLEIGSVEICKTIEFYDIKIKNSRMGLNHTL